MSNVVYTPPVNFSWDAFQTVQRALFGAIEKKGYKNVVLDLSRLKKGYPNGFIPLITLCERYRKKDGVDFEFIWPEDDSLRRLLDNHNWIYYLSGSGNISDSFRSLSRFSDDDANLNDVIDRKIKQLLGEVEFADGVAESFEWALSEIAGNVLSHAEMDHGWLQVDFHRTSRHLVVAVADGGRGIPNTIQKRFPERTRDVDALEFALQEGVTSKPDFGQGKGLTGTLQIVSANRQGFMAIHSQHATFEFKENRPKYYDQSVPFPGTFVDIQLDTTTAINIAEALWGKKPNNFSDLVYGRDTPAGVMRLVLSEEASRFSNRVTGKKIHTKITNLLRVGSEDVLEIDFKGVELIASSFADEVFGKLAVDMGIVYFATRIRFIGINNFCRRTIDDVVQSRMIQHRQGL